MKLIQAQRIVEQLYECLDLLQSMGMEDHPVALNIAATLDGIHVGMETGPDYPDTDESEDQ